MDSHEHDPPPSPSPSRSAPAPATDRPLESIAVEPLLTRDFETRPELVYERLREKYGPVAPVDVLGVRAWLALGYPQVLEVLRNDTGVWSKRLGDWRARTAGQVPPDWPLSPALEVDHVIFQEGDRLSDLRDAWRAALRPYQDPTQRQAKELAAMVATSADHLITLMSEGGGRTGWADLSAQYTRPLPLMVVNHLLGLDGARPHDTGTGTGTGTGADHAQSEDTLMDMWRVLDAGPDAGPALDRLLVALSDLAAAKMTDPGDDIPSAMLAARPEFTVDELSRELMMLVGVTCDHLGIVICNTIAEVINGGGSARARLSDGMVRETIEQVAMERPPMINLTFRFPTADTTLGDFTIAAGDPVMPAIAAAHADPLFTDQKALGRDTHLAWGAGPHHCLARELATTVTAIAVRRLFDRFDRLETALPADQLPWRSSPLMRALRSLPVRYELAAPPADPPPDSEVRPPAEATTMTVPTADGPDGGPETSAGLLRFLRGLRRGQ